MLKILKGKRPNLRHSSFYKLIPYELFSNCGGGGGGVWFGSHNYPFNFEAGSTSRLGVKRLQSRAKLLKQTIYFSSKLYIYNKNGKDCAIFFKFSVEK